MTLGGVIYTIVDIEIVYFMVYIRTPGFACLGHYRHFCLCLVKSFVAYSFFFGCIFGVFGLKNPVDVSPDS